MSEHRSALLKRDRLRERSAEAAERFEREYVRVVGEGAPPAAAFSVARLFAVEDRLPESASRELRQERRAWREDVGLPPERDTDDVTDPDPDELPSIESLSDAAHSAVS